MYMYVCINIYIYIYIFFVSILPKPYIPGAHRKPELEHQPGGDRGHSAADRGPATLNYSYIYSYIIIIP